MSYNPPDAPDTGELNKLLDRFSELCEDNRHAPENCRCREVIRGSVLDLFERLQKENEREERAASQLLDERDAAEEALSQAYFLITGRSPEWSNLFGYREALDEVDNAQELLRDEISSLRSTALTRDEAEAPLVGEMIAQARLGHKRFCVGAHEHEGGELEYEWIDWSEAFARPSSLRSSFLGEQK